MFNRIHHGKFKNDKQHSLRFHFKFSTSLLVRFAFCERDVGRSEDVENRPVLRQVVVRDGPTLSETRLPPGKMSLPGKAGLFCLASLCSWLWYQLYQFYRFKHKYGGEFTTRIVAGIHGVACIILSCLALIYGPDPLDGIGEPNTFLQSLTMVISLGFFVYDFVWCVKYQPEIKIILAHHFGGIVSLTFILCCGFSGAEAIAGLGSMEFTNPMVQARWFLRTFEKKDTILYQVVEYCFLVSFLTVRLGYGSCLFFAIMTSEKTLFMVKCCSLIMCGVSIALIYNILQFISKKINDRNLEDDDIKLC
ncbi:transmembrane protein 136-like isoform X1 [Cimex lectularius]|uniref:TLC domain-containing protein n=1 Tax=Cimex lectularius TaxID=79782 RepID=A0A8I6RTT5_CIMLE|nr:transmembrane protein 136-like isoform X1 [Cimex lectularius]